MFACHRQNTQRALTRNSRVVSRPPEGFSCGYFRDCAKPGVAPRGLTCFPGKALGSFQCSGADPVSVVSLPLGLGGCCHPHGSQSSKTSNVSVTFLLQVRCFAPTGIIGSVAQGARRISLRTCENLCRGHGILVYTQGPKPGYTPPRPPPWCTPRAPSQGIHHRFFDGFS